jgi:NAD(P)-dependent dehydrogenase (short-subunit alcohol dehydrogenase family)
MTRLRDKVIIITGAAQGLGREYSIALAKEGAFVSLIDVNDKVRETFELVKSNGGSGYYFIGDVTKEEDVLRFVNETYKIKGKIDVLINNAAIYYGLKNRPFYEIPEDEWDRVFKVNVKGVWLMSKAVVPYMIKQKYGNIINISSVTFFFGAPGLMHYVASKGAVIGITRVMAKELGKYNIRVNCVAPGLVPTEASLARVNNDYIRKVEENTSLGKITTPKDLANVMIFLSSDESNQITGQTIVVDGGYIFH